MPATQPIERKIEQALVKVHDQATFIKDLLIDTLEWPIGERVDSVEDIAYRWSTEELRASDLNDKLVDGEILQVANLYPDQPWGIFILEFKNPEVFTTGRGMTGPLRRVLRGLVPSRRGHSNLPSWNRENLLFICTYNYEYFRFAYFRAPLGETKTAPLAAFGWGPDEPARTACEFNLPELTWPDQAISSADWVARWAAAFDVERVTKKFYEDYAATFTKVERLIKKQNDFTAPEDLRLFTQTLFNRLMFLRFIERKHWLELNGHHDYLRALYEAGTARPRSFYTRRILPLFFEALAIEGFKCPPELGRVQFLNGGLFEQSDLDRKVKGVPDEAFAPIIARDGLFYRYNFTVEESTPLDIEVAVDPEMLGKVFEELVTGRHESGSYYTPRLVVAFMCREAIKGYLASHTKASIGALEALVDRHEVKGLTELHGRQILDALDALKAVDPACGSGAYLLGLLQEMIAVYRLLYSEKLVKDSRSLYDLKMRIVSHNLYGVDIDRFATNIAMLRLWLSLAVEAAEPLPLPNLDFKIETGDSLSGPCDVHASHLDFHGLRIAADALVDQKDRYLRAHGEEKAALRQVIHNLERSIKERMRSLYADGVIDWRVAFADVLGRHGGFDVVLANPPYVRKEEIPPALKPMLKERFGYAITGRSDLYCSFYARGVELLRESGVHVFVCSSSWLDAAYGGPLQGHLLRTCHVQSIIDSIAEKQFSTANVNTIISVLKKDSAGLDKDARFTMLRAPFVKAIRDERQQSHVAVRQRTLLERGTRGAEYVGDKWGGKYLRAPASYKLIFGDRSARFMPLSAFADVIGYIHDNNTGGSFPKRNVLWSLRDARAIHVRPNSEGVRRVGVNPSGNSTKWAPLVFARTMGTRHLVCRCDPGVLCKEFYRITPHKKISEIALAAQLNSVLGILQREILGIRGLGGGAIKFAAADVEQFLLLPDIPEEKIGPAFGRLADRPIGDIEEELARDDRRELDSIIFDHLGMQASDLVRTYDETLALVLARRDKARNVM